MSRPGRATCTQLGTGNDLNVLCFVEVTIFHAFNVLPFARSEPAGYGHLQPMQQVGSFTTRPS